MAPHSVAMMQVRSVVSFIAITNAPPWAMGSEYASLMVIMMVVDKFPHFLPVVCMVKGFDDGFSDVGKLQLTKF
jgi:hypothetical protein